MMGKKYGISNGKDKKICELIQLLVFITNIYVEKSKRQNVAKVIG